jgi:predicted O-methyltransferase YrrM/uncharacterized protein YifN (PemK superfamily)
MIQATQQSLDLVHEISRHINDQTFHHHYHVLYDIANTFAREHSIDYLEIGCYAGGSACLMLQRPHTQVTSIDLGWPVSPDTVQANVARLNHCGNSFRYIQGNSSDPGIIDQARDRLYDILFVDGDHSYHGVWRDFMAYHDMVKPGGYLVFDDYNDTKHSPAVHSAVDHIANQCRNSWEILGTVPNDLEARPKEIQQGNCFIMRRHDHTQGPDIAVTIATYRRRDGTTPQLLRRTLDSVMRQDYRRWQIFLVGDRYDQPREIQDLLSDYPLERIHWTNLAVADERDHYTDPGILWRTGGINAFNTAIDEALMAGFQYVAHLDHDDVWQRNHLSEIAAAINLTGAAWICTRAQHTDGQVLPKLINEQDHIVPFVPRYSTVVHSSVCMDFTQIPLRYRNIYKHEHNLNRAGDSDLWERANRYILANNLRSVAVNRLTCSHQQEHQ